MIAPFPIFCASPRCRAAVRALRRARRSCSWPTRRAGVQQERRYRASARRCASCVHCGRDTRLPLPLEHRTFEDCARRYPALVTSLAWILCGSGSEAACCVRDFRDRMRFGAEVVSHSGLGPADRVWHARRAWRVRQTREMLRPLYRDRVIRRRLEHRGAPRTGPGSVAFVLGSFALVRP